jgi:hypothetical protein
MKYDIMVDTKTRAITSSTDATPIVITTAANHGLATGDRVTIFGHTTNVAANGTWTITYVAAGTFSLQGSVGSGAGAGAAGVYSAQAPKALFAADAETIQFSFVTDGGGDCAVTVKAAISNSENCPDFAKAQSATNQYDYVDIVDLEDNASIDGDTGISLAGADDSRIFEVNTNHAKWFTIIPTAGTAGEITVRATLVCEN